jgi:thymidylate kinase
MSSRPPERAAPRRPRGRFIVVVGPDGVGKTTVARHLVRLANGTTAYFHFRPPVLSPMASGPPDSMDPPLDKSPSEGSVVLGWVRILRNLLWFWVAYLYRVRPALSKGTMVVGDRWAYGYLAQPGALKFFGPEWVARGALALFPHPDLIANLVAPVEVIRDRKAELSGEQIAAELEAWAGVPGVVSIDAAKGPEETARAILRALQ